MRRHGFQALLAAVKDCSRRPQYLHFAPTHVCSIRSNQMLPSSLAKPLAMECSPLACFEQYTLRRASRLVKIRNADAEHLLGQNMFDALIKVRYLVDQSFCEPSGDFA